MQLRVLGIDPGTRVVGWAVLENQSDGIPRRIASGSWKLGDSKTPIQNRLLSLRENLVTMLRQHKPAQLALEAAFFGKNARSALRIGEARGVVMMTCAELGMNLAELPPAVVKRRIAGAGAASKEQIARLVAIRLGLPEDFAFSTFDESDALAVALCGLDLHVRAEAMPALEMISKGSRAKRGLPPGASLQ